MQIKRLIPLRLCEVLETEFISLHGALPASYPDWELKTGQVRFDKFRQALIHVVENRNENPSASAVFDLLKNSLTDDWMEVLHSNLEAQSSLVNCINNAFKNSEQGTAPLYPPSLLPERSEARRLAELAPSTWGFERLERRIINRLLLEAAFPDAVRSIDEIRLAAIRSCIHQLETGRTALCLSGGGIRSAAFSLGIVQGFAAKGLLDKFDYLSTVSGGGYLGSWLSAWIHRHPAGIDGVVAELAAHNGARGRTTLSNSMLHPAPAPVRFLRRFSAFLTPRVGFFSTDSWTWIGIYLRNLSLNWLVLLPLMLLILAVPRLYLLMSTENFLFQSWQERLASLTFWISTICGVLVIVCVAVNLPSASDTVRSSNRNAGISWMNLDALRRGMRQPGCILIFGVVPLIAFSCIVSLMLRDTDMLFVDRILYFLGWGGLFISIGWLLSIAMLPRRKWGPRCLELVLMLVAGMVTWLVVTSFASWVKQAEGVRVTWLALTLDKEVVYAMMAGPATIFACLVGMTLFIGLVSKRPWIDDEDYEWWAKFGAWLLIACVGWAIANIVVVVGPSLLIESPQPAAAAGGISGLFAVLVGKSSLSAFNLNGSRQASQQKGALAAAGINTLALAALVFLFIFLSFLSLLTSALLQFLTRTLNDLPAHACNPGLTPAELFNCPIFSSPDIHLAVTRQTSLFMLIALILGLAAIMAFAASTINLNKFSLHGAYRSRLIRTFLGASRGDERRPNSFTGFDPFDNVQMHELQSGLLHEGDIQDVAKLVETLKLGLASSSSPSPPDVASCVVCLMLNLGPKNEDTLANDLALYKLGQPVLKKLQGDVLERLNRVLQTVRLVDHAPFREVDVHAQAENDLRHGNLIYANRRLLDSSLSGLIRPYNFPPRPPRKFLLVVNLALNLVAGKNLAWQERKATSFIVTPMHAGCYYLGFRNSREYGGERGITLGTAAAISGAAVSPNMGHSSSPIVTLLLTLFNVRLGWWLGNPGTAGKKTYHLPAPYSWLRPLLSEALGMTDDESRYVYLSDGGHFENLGLYEMVLRRSRLIVVCDATADPHFGFESLANAVRKIRIDFGIPIEFDSMRIYPKKADSDDDGNYCALGKVRYSAVDGTVADGTIIYFKPVVYGKESRDILHYKAKHAAFPHESTTDQFFAESQFESYRRLGEFAVEQVCAKLQQNPDALLELEPFLVAARSHCHRYADLQPKKVN